MNARKAVAWGIDRSSISSIYGKNAHTPQCSLLTPAVPGYKKCTIYPSTPDLARARALALPHATTRINYWYNSSTSGPQIQQLVTAQLRAIGFTNIEHRAFSSGLFSALGRRGNDYDLAAVAWSAPFPDPSAVLNTLLSGETIRATENTNIAYFNNDEANWLLRRAASLTGKKRLEAYGNLDLLIQRRWAPVVVLGRRNDRAFFSDRIDTKSIVQSPVYELDLGRLALRGVWLIRN